MSPYRLMLVLAIASCGDNVVTMPDANFVDPPPPAMLGMDPKPVAFGTIVVGTVSPLVTLTIRNDGGYETGTITPIMNGVDAASFQVKNGCTTLASRGRCVITVAFAPTTVGMKTASVSVSASPGGTVRTDVSGDAITP